MGSKQQAQKSSEYAKFMKAKGIRRTSTNCPMGCGARLSIPLNINNHHCPTGTNRFRRWIGRSK